MPLNIREIIILSYREELFSFVCDNFYYDKSFNELEEIHKAIIDLDYPKGIIIEKSKMPRGFGLYKSAKLDKKWSELSDYEKSEWNNRANRITNEYIANNRWIQKNFRKIKTRKNKKSEKRKFSPGQLFIHEYLKINKTNNISKAWKKWKKLENKSKYIEMHLELYK